MRCSSIVHTIHIVRTVDVVLEKHIQIQFSQHRGQIKKHNDLRPDNALKRVRF